MLLKEQITSLEKKLLHESGEERIRILVELATLHQYVDNRKILKYTHEVLESNAVPFNSPFKAKAIANKVISCFSDGRFTKAQNIIDESLATLNPIIDELSIVIIKIPMLILYGIIGKLDEAVIEIEQMEPIVEKYNLHELSFDFKMAKHIALKKKEHLNPQLLFECLKMAEEVNREWEAGYVHTLIGDFYDTEEQPEIAHLHFDKAIDIGKRHDGYLFLLQAYLFKFTNLVVKKINLDEAETIISNAIDICIKINNESLLNYARNKKINLLILEKKYDLAIEESFIIEKESIKHERSNFNFIYNLRASTYFKMHKYKEALDIFIKLENDITFTSILENQAPLYLNISNCYHMLANFEQAYLYYVKYTEVLKTILNTEKIKSNAEIQTKYDTEKKEAALKELKIDQLNSELKALKSQMNPHFIFNVMSTVDSLIEIGKQNEARKSLRMFSKMMRNTLEQSNEDTTLLEDEISLLESYITLEKLLLGDDFNFEINVDENIDAGYDTIPAMLLQPIVENAIKHGLKHKLGNKDLKVSFKLMNEVLHIEIEDNGIGRVASAKINESRKNHQSFATKSIEDRINIINEQHAINISIETIDKYDHEKKSLGTKVILTIAK